jgi:hypothetical protein
VPRTQLLQPKRNCLIVNDVPAYPQGQVDAEEHAVHVRGLAAGSLPGELRRGERTGTRKCDEISTKHEKETKLRMHCLSFKANFTKRAILLRPPATHQCRNPASQSQNAPATHPYPYHRSPDCIWIHFGASQYRRLCARQSKRIQPKTGVG